MEHENATIVAKSNKRGGTPLGRGVDCVYLTNFNEKKQYSLFVENISLALQETTFFQPLQGIECQ